MGSDLVLSPQRLRRLVEMGLVAEGAQLSPSVLADLAAFLDGEPEPAAFHCKATIIDEPLATLRAHAIPTTTEAPVSVASSRRALRMYRSFRAPVALDELFVSTPALAV